MAVPLSGDLSKRRPRPGHLIDLNANSWHRADFYFWSTPRSPVIPVRNGTPSRNISVESKPQTMSQSHESWDSGYVAAILDCSHQPLRNG